MKVTRKPTRRDLLKIITELQGEIGTAIGKLRDDRDSSGYEAGMKGLEQAMGLCIDARSFDPPTDIKG